MIIGIDARFALCERRGIGNYSLHLIRCLSEIDRNNNYILYTDRDDVEGVLPKQGNFEIKNIGSWNYFIWEQLLLPFQVKKDRICVLHCPANTAPMVLPRGLMLISTVHDVSYLKPYSLVPKSPHLYQRLGRIYRKAIVPRALKRVSALITVSEFAKQDILSHIPSLSEARVFITYEAMSESFRAIDKAKAKSFVKLRYGITDTYILNVGGRDPQKNTKFLIENFIAFKKTKNISVKLLVVGFPNYDKTGSYKDLKNSGLLDEVIFIDFACESDLLQLYNGAAIFVFPSLYESFGIPPLEAMACGIPVIASNTGAIPEIVGDAALLIDPRRGEELVLALSKLLTDQKARADLVRRGLENVKKYSWRIMSKETLRIYENVCI